MPYTLTSESLSPNDAASLVEIDFDSFDMELRQGRLDALEKMCAERSQSPGLSAEQLGWVRFFQGVVALRRGDSARAEEYLVAAAESAPLWVRNRVVALRSSLKVTDGDLSGARALLGPLMANPPLEYGTLTVWGRILMASGDENGAWRAFLDALEIAPTGIDAVHHLVSIGLKAGRVVTLKRALERFIEFEPENLNVRCFLSAACLAAGDVDRARREVKRVAAFAGLAPLDPDARGVLETVSRALPPEEGSP